MSAGHRSIRSNWKVKGLQALKLNFCVTSINRFSFVFFSSFHWRARSLTQFFLPIIIIICCHFLSVWREKKLNEDCCYCCWGLCWMRTDFEMSFRLSSSLFILIENFHSLLHIEPTIHHRKYDLIELIVKWTRFQQTLIFSGRCQLILFHLRVWLNLVTFTTKYNYENKIRKKYKFEKNRFHFLVLLTMWTVLFSVVLFLHSVKFRNKRIEWKDSVEVQLISFHAVVTATWTKLNRYQHKKDWFSRWFLHNRENAQ